MTCLKLMQTNDLAICIKCETKDTCKIYEIVMQVKKEIEEAFNQYYTGRYTGTVDIQNLEVKLQQGFVEIGKNPSITYKKGANQ